MQLPRLCLTIAVLILPASLPLHAAVGASTSALVSVTDTEIEHLLAHVKTLTDAHFIRNGTEYPAAKAADHLRLKWNKQRTKITSAELFIQLCATGSSLSGEAYSIRFADGRTIPCADLLTNELTRFRATSSTFSAN